MLVGGRERRLTFLTPSVELVDHSIYVSFIQFSLLVDTHALAVCMPCVCSLCMLVCVHVRLAVLICLGTYSSLVPIFHKVYLRLVKDCVKYYYCCLFMVIFDKYVLVV